jgi:hypothetical protein
MISKPSKIRRSGEGPSERVAEVNAEADADTMKAVSTLVEALKNDKAAGTSNVHIHAAMTGGVAGLVGAQTVSVGSMEIGVPQPEKKD